jgi:transcriptional regulator GlxA family with amidase domain
LENFVRQIAVIIFDGAEELDFVGPWEVFTMLGQAVEGSCRVFTVSETGEEVRCAKGLRVGADYSFADCPAPDIYLVPGGQGTRRESENRAMLDFLMRITPAAELATSVCTGSFVLEAAGLLAGKRATTHWASIDHLKTKAGVTVVEHERFVDEGKVITASGVSAGIDMALHVVGRLWDPATARKVQKYMEYYPDPPWAETEARP